MSARKMVQEMRDNGAFDAPVAAVPWRTTLVSFAGGLALGAGVYVGAIYGLPVLADTLQKPPPVVEFAKPGGN